MNSSDSLATASSPSADVTDNSCCFGGQLPAPLPQHAWLERFVGTWDTEVEIVMGPDKPPFVTRGVETIRRLGGHWVVAEGENTTTGFAHLMMLGYDASEECYVGSWIDSMSGWLWRYRGRVDQGGERLTLETRGPSPLPPAADVAPSAGGGGAVTPPAGPVLAPYREITVFVEPEVRVFTSEFQAPDGAWHRLLTVTSRRR